MEKIGEIEPELNGLIETRLFLEAGSRLAISWLQRLKILPSESARVNHRGLDTQRLLQIAAAIALLIVGKYLDRWFTRKPKLISYIGHAVLPENYQVIPTSVSHRLEGAAGGPAEIILDRMVSGEQVTISYLYWPPLLWNNVNSYTKSDEGFAKIVNVLPT